MNLKKENGFSLIELLIVCVIMGIVASLAVPALRKSIQAAENQSAFSTMRSIGQAQANFYSQKSRYARLDELNTAQNGVLGTLVSTDIIRGPFRFTLTSDSSDTALKTQYSVTGTRPMPTGLPYVYSIDASGAITQITP